MILGKLLKSPCTLVSLLINLEYYYQLNKIKLENVYTCHISNSRNVFINGFLHSIPACKWPVSSLCLNLSSTNTIFQRHCTPVQNFSIFPAFYITYFPIHWEFSQWRWRGRGVRSDVLIIIGKCKTVGEEVAERDDIRGPGRKDCSSNS